MMSKIKWIWVLKFGSLFAVFLMFFFPAVREHNSVELNTKLFRTQIVDIKKISTGFLTPNEFKQINNYVKEFESKLIDLTQASKRLDFISDQADKHHFNVIQVYSDRPIHAKNELGQDLEFKGKKLKRLPISFRVETDYKNFGNFLKSVMDNIQANVLVESLILKKTSSQAENLQCDITLSCLVV